MQVKSSSEQVGFTAQVHQRQMIGQVALYQVAEPEQAQEKITNKKTELLELANQAILLSSNVEVGRVICMSSR